MKNLESMTEIAEKDLKISRDEMFGFSVMSHFAGELAMVYCFITKVTIPVVVASMEKVEFDFENIAVGMASTIAAYAIPHISSIYLRGLSMTKEEHENYSKKLEKNLTNEVIGTPKWFINKMDRILIKEHYGCAKNHERHERVIQKYTLFKKRHLNKANI